MLEVRTGCRLHFGLMELSAGAPLRFAGLGLMLSDPGFVLTFSGREQQRNQAGSSYADYAPPQPIESIDAEVTRRIGQVVEIRHGLSSAETYDMCRHCHIDVRQALPLHSGLGAGTQLACAAAVGLELLTQVSSQTCSSSKTAAVSSSSEAGWSRWQPLSELRPDLTARWLVRHAGRGLRSAVGLTGFLRGGLLLDKGYSPQLLPELADRPLTGQSTLLPESWRVVLIVPSDRQPIHGGREAKLMEQLGAQPNPRCGQMLKLAEHISQYAQLAEGFHEFVGALETYMELGARLFSDYQQGLYNGAEIAAAVEQAQAAGLRGVGQSSWGPTVFGFTPTATQAVGIAERLAAGRPDWKVTITKPASSGAEVRWLI